MFYTIYKITNLLNNKIYIGKHQTKNLDDGYMGSGKHLKNSMKKYGIENFSKEILFVFDNEDEMNLKEAELVTIEFCKDINTYNICEGGKGGFGYLNLNGLNRNEWHQETLNTHMKNMSVLGNLKKNKLLEDETWRDNYCKKQSESRKEYFKNNPAGFEGRSHSDETKKKMSESKKNKTKGKNNSQFGTMWITNGLENKKIRKDDDIPTGFRKGRVCK